MKKYYTTPEYKKWNKAKSKKIERKLRSARIKELRERRIKRRHRPKKLELIKAPVYAPSDLRLVEETEDCLAFFRDVRSEDYVSRRGPMKYVIMSLEDVTQIDYGTISILTAINDDLKFKGILLRTLLPEHEGCKRFMIEAGYLNNLCDDRGRPFTQTQGSELLFFEKGSGLLSVQDNMRISNTIKKVVEHLTGELAQCLPVKTIVLEVCGNSIEWGGTDSKQWLLGVKYETNRVVFTVTDVGKGILETLHKKFATALKDIFSLKSNADILRGAFEQKYGSNTQEVNRNKGLPAVKHNFEQGIIRNLKVMCNNAILHFDDEANSKTFGFGKARFRGTFYQWEMTKESIMNIGVNKNEDIKYS